MSTAPTLNPPSQRYPFEAEIAQLPAGLQQAHRYAFNGLVDLNQAIVALKSQVDANKTSISNAAATVTNTNTSSETVIVSPSSVGTFNDQSGNTSYTTGQVDAGAFILFSDASPIAVTLGSSPTIQLPFYCTLINEGVGLITVTPSIGLISYPGNLGAANMTIPQFFAATIAYDGSNYFAVLYCVPPQNTPAVAHQFLTAFNSTSGAFSQAQPAYSDLTGTPQLPNTIAPVAGEYLTGYDATTGNFSQSTPPGISVTIVTAQLTPTGTQGSMVFTNGILTSQVQAT